MSKLVGLVGWRGMVGSVLMDRMAAALATRGVGSAWVVHGHGGLDELAVSGPNTAYSPTKTDEVRRLVNDTRWSDRRVIRPSGTIARRTWTRSGHETGR